MNQRIEVGKLGSMVIARTVSSNAEEFWEFVLLYSSVK
jgi:hypothetical protein